MKQKIVHKSVCAFCTTPDTETTIRSKRFDDQNETVLVRQKAPVHFHAPALLPNENRSRFTYVPM